MAKPVPLSRYLLGNLALLVIPILLASTIGLSTLTEIVRESFINAINLSGTLATARFDEFFKRPKEALSHIEAILANAELYPRMQLQAYLENARREYSFFDRIQIIDSNGLIIAVSPPEPELIGISRAGETVFESVIATSEIFWSDSYISTVDNRPALTFGQHIGHYTVLCDLNLGWLADFSKSVQIYEMQKMEVRVTDRNGIFLSSPEEGEVERRERHKHFKVLSDNTGLNAVHRIEQKGKTWLVSTMRVAGPGWYVFTEFPETLFSETLITHEISLLLIATISVLMVALFWRVRFRKVATILTAISSQADRISAGEYEPLAAFGGGFIEFEKVGKSLDSMVTAIGKREDILENREAGFRAILERISLPAVSIDTSGIITFANESMKRMVATSDIDLLGKPIGILHPAENHDCPFDRFGRGLPVGSLEQCHILDAEGSVRIIDWNIVHALNEGGALAGLTAIGHDLTESLRQHESVERALREKEILLRELFHRTRNNMQVIMSILTSEALETADESVDRVVHKVNSRIMSMSIVHKKLFESGDLSQIDLRDYCVDLIDFLGKGERGKGRLLTLKLPDEPVTALIDSAIPFGLVLHELVTNALKYAYPDGKPGEIRIAIGKTEDLGLWLEVADDGIGLPERFDPHANGKLGFKLILGLVESQLRGSLELRNTNGVSGFVRFSGSQTLKRV